MIAEKVMGWKWMQHSPSQEEIPGYGWARYRFLADPEWVKGLGTDPSWVIVSADMARPIQDNAATPCYSTDISAAWLVVARIEQLGWWVELWYGNGLYGPKKRAGCTIGAYGDDDTKFEAMADTMPYAICMAALEAMGVSINEQSLPPNARG